MTELEIQSLSFGELFGFSLINWHVVCSWWKETSTWVFVKLWNHFSRNQSKPHDILTPCSRLTIANEECRVQNAQRVDEWCLMSSPANELDWIGLVLNVHYWTKRIGRRSRKIEIMHVVNQNSPKIFMILLLLSHLTRFNKWRNCITLCWCCVTISTFLFIVRYTFVLALFVKKICASKKILEL